MARRLRRTSAFDRWMGGRVYLYYLIGWICMVIYGASIWTAEVQSFLDIIPLAIGMFIIPLVPFLILVFLDYIAFCIHQHKQIGKYILYDGYASGWEIQTSFTRIPILNEDQFPDERYSIDKAKEET